MRVRTLAACVVIVAIAALTTLHHLGDADVCGSNEAVEAVFLQQMVEHNALLFPLENGRSPMYKPPLFHWTAVAIDRLAGIKKVTAFNLRLPAALYAIAGVVLTIAFAYAFLGPDAAILAGLILIASYQYVENARIGRVDMTLCFFETLSLFSFMWRFSTGDSFSSASQLRPQVHTETRPHPARSSFARLVFAISLGLAVLAKGPVGALLPALAILIFLIAERRFSDVWKLATPTTVILTLAIGSSWYLACLFGHRYGFLDRQIGSENFGRFFGALGAMPPWYYLKPLLLNSAPLSLLVPLAVLAALRTYRRPSPMLDRPSDPSPPPNAPAAPGDRPEDLSLSTEKSPAVNEVHRPAGEGAPSSLTPPGPAGEVLPTSATQQRRPSQNPLSLWMALRMMFLPLLDPSDDRVTRAWPTDGMECRAVRLFAIFWVVTVLFFTLAAYKRRAYLLPLWPASAVMLAWWITALGRTRPGNILRGAVVAICAILIAVNFFYLPRKEVRDCAGDSMRPAAAQINRVVGPTEPLYLFGFDDEPAPLLFYLDRTAPRIWGKLGDAPPGYVIVTADAWQRLKDQALDLQPVIETTSGRPHLILLRRGKALAHR
jgi:4-amino-4-deoxy-L-arabinose transferase-like glycosyltransferase